MNTQTPSRLALVTLGAAAILAYAPLAQAKVPFDPTMISDVAEQVTPAVVNITTRKNGNVPEGHPMLREMFGRGMPMVGAGSGVVVSADGDIVTNNHVVEGADEIKVTFADKREFDAKLVGTDKASDLAFLKIEAKGLPYLRFGDSSKLRLGEFVLAVGNPFGVGQTVTMGIVSAKGRAGMGIVDYEEFIQTDASINPGNSGGALVNLEGELVGINTAILSRSGGNQGVGFAVPSNMVRPIREQLAKYGRVRRGYLGVYIQDLTPELASGVKANDLKGVLVTDVQEDSPAAKANVEVGDVITQVDGNPTLTAAQLRNRVALIEPGSKVKLDVMREGQAKTVYVTLTEKEGGQVALQSGEGAAPLGAGLGLAKLDAELRGRLRLPPRVDGVVVMNVAPGSPADLAGLEPGDVIVSVDRRTVKKPGDVEKLLKRDGGQALLRVYKNGAFTFVVLKGK